MNAAEPNDSSVRITNREIYDTLVAIDRKLDPIPGQVSDHEVRIRAIEKYLWIWIGASGVLGGAITTLVRSIFAG